jgi:adenine-specific DNA-methyltransferase
MSKTNAMTVQDAKEKGLASMDISAEKREQLKALMPEAFSEDKLDIEQLKRIIGEWVEPGKERFGLSWPGKAECMKIIQQPSVATLKPARDESVNFDNTENLFIEGDNLEVLKLLQKSYFGKVKMIYIDPPYNTGKEFIYPDKYAETLDTYLAYTGQVDDEGRKFATNTDANGRKHSNWLNMMYSRLYLAKNLLREDGVIFISIDDNELHHLRMLCDQILGEENFAGVFPWRSRTAKADVPFGVSVDVEWVICYGKRNFIAGRAGERNYYKSDDYEDRWRLSDLTTNKTKDERPNSYFTMINPKNGDEYPASETRTWSVTTDTFQDYYDKGKIVFPGDYDFLNIKKPAFRVFESEDKQKALEKYGTEEVKMSVSTYLPEKDVGRTEHGSKEIRELFGAQVFSYPKPTGLIKFFIENISDPEAVIMDFFAGSGTTADAVMQVNAQDGGKRKFILVQLPEALDLKSTEQKTAAEYCKANGIPLNISALSQERIRRAAKKIAEKQDKELDLNGNGNLDLGFKVFKLSRSNFNVWEGDVEKIKNLEEQLSLHVDHIDGSSTPEDILYELLLKAGFPLTTSLKKTQMAGKDVFSIEDGAMLICLDKDLTAEVIDAMAEANPVHVICLDEGFKGNDQLKTNAVQTFKARAQEEETEIVFQTV